MPDPSLHTTQLRTWLDRMRDGDPAAREELLRATCVRLERLARKMLDRFPNVRRWADTGDVLNPSLMRLLRALQELRPAATRDFFNLAAVQMRRELLDLARHFYGPQGQGANHASLPPNPQAGDPCDGVAQDADPGGAADLERWSAFHEAVERLPAEEREVVSLAFYHGWTQAEIGELFGVEERTVRRRWRAACLKLHEALKGGPPELAEKGDAS
jgi:RNA polymerase sigma-70 factor (ECF subfamily)